MQNSVDSKLHGNERFFKKWQKPFPGETLNWRWFAPPLKFGFKNLMPVSGFDLINAKQSKSFYDSDLDINEKGK